MAENNDPPGDPTPPGRPRGAGGQFVQNPPAPTPPAAPAPTPNQEIAALRAEIAELSKKLIPEAPQIPSKTGEAGTIKPTKYEIQYAEKLKVELGDKYDKKLDALTVGNRIDTMEAVITALKGKVEPTQKGGEGSDAGSPPPPVNTKPKSFLAQQKEKGYREKLRDRGSYAQVAKKLYNTK